MNRSQAYLQLKSARDEFAASRFSVVRAMHEVALDPNVLHSADHPIRPSDLREASGNMEITYMLRLFAEFEMILRDYWAVIRPSLQPRRTRMEILMNRIAARQYTDMTVLSDAHAVREYRNNIIHDRLRTPRMTMQECASRLGHFVSYLPVRW